MANFISQKDNYTVDENNRTSNNQEEPKSRRVHKILIKPSNDQKRVFGINLKNLNADSAQSSKDFAFLEVGKKERKNGSNIYASSSNRDQKDVATQNISKESNVIKDRSIYVEKPKTPSKEQVQKNSIFLLQSKRKSFANDVKRIINPVLRPKSSSTEIEKNDPQFVKEYADEIYKYLRENECKNLPSPFYMDQQKDINTKMRAILVDWLILVHQKLKLKQETLFLTVNIMDRYMEKVKILRSKLQLVGIVSLLLACKYEEIYPPEIEILIDLTDNSFTREEFLEMELNVIGTLKFKFTFASSHLFLERYAKIANINPETYYLARYLIELAIFEYRMLKHPPSLTACSAINLALRIMKKSSWPDVLILESRYIESDLVECSKDLLFLLKYHEHYGLSAIKNKYASENFMKISLLNFF